MNTNFLLDAIILMIGIGTFVVGHWLNYVAERRIAVWNRQRDREIVLHHNERALLQSQLDFAHKRIAFLESPLPTSAISGAFAQQTDHLAAPNIGKTVILSFKSEMDALNYASMVAGDIERRSP